MPADVVSCRGCDNDSGTGTDDGDVADGSGDEVSAAEMMWMSSSKPIT